MVPTPGIEPGTYRLGGGRSIRLSYEGGAGRIRGRKPPTHLGSGWVANLTTCGRGVRERRRCDGALPTAQAMNHCWFVWLGAIGLWLVGALWLLRSAAPTSN